MSRLLRSCALLAVLLTLSACSDEATSASDATPAGASDATGQPQDGASGTKAERAAAAGLSDAQTAALDSLEVPVYIPALPEGWTLTDASTERLESDGTVYPGYELHYRTAAQTCLHLVAASEGLGDVFVMEPPHTRDVTVTGVPTDGPTRLGWGVAGETAEGWDGGRVATEWFRTGDLSLSLQSPDDADACGPASPEDAEALLVSLRALDPADDVTTD